MHTDTPKKKPTGDGNPTAGHTDTATVAVGDSPDKAFQAMRAAFAKQGQTLHRTGTPDGPATYWAERWGLVRHLSTIDAARRFLEQVWGRL
jgi:hypothetical protein